MFKQILVPVDGSEHAERALALAADLAARYDAKLHVVHALLRGDVPDHLRKLSDKKADPEPGIALGGAYVDASLPFEVLEDIAGKLLEQARKTAEKHGAKQVDTSSHQGDPARVILEQADKQGADLVVMGSRGLSDIKGLVIGSVSHKVAHLFEGSVVTVK